MNRHRRVQSDSVSFNRRAECCLFDQCAKSPYVVKLKITLIELSNARAAKDFK